MKQQDEKDIWLKRHKRRSAWQQQALPAADHASFMHASTADCAPFKLLLPLCIAYSLPLGNEQQIVHQRLPDQHTSAQDRGAWVLLPIASANF
eukprot:1158581-Pelagomonas_calceolata.AAC.1